MQADRSGLRGFLYESERLDLSLSFSGSLPVNSQDNDTREAMDDLDLLLEAGPTLQYTLYENDTQRLRVDIPIRAAFSLGISFLITRAGQRMAFIL
ncbi:MAG: MipA/OmpV family protein [Spongiibacteraceae bacterium]|nr:MipA/OmpV family protein [Spongiibacteraceae bacterium]